MSDERLPDAIERAKLAYSEAVYMHASCADEMELALDAAILAALAERERKGLLRAVNWIDGRTLGYPHGDLREMKDWLMTLSARQADGD